MIGAQIYAFTVSAILALAVCLGSPQSATACEGEVFKMPASTSKSELNPPIKIKSDCSFEDIAYNGHQQKTDHAYIVGLSYFGGAAARDRGNGRIGQKIIDGKGCSSIEKLLVVDCNGGDATLIDGITPPEYRNANISVNLIELIQPPLGPISVTGQTTIPELVKQARDNGLTVTTDVYEFFAKRGKDKYEYKCGCQLYYPGSLGADQ